MVDILEWIGTLSSLSGAFLLATHNRVSQYGWIAFLIANLALIGFSLGIGRHGLLLQQIGFTATSLIGLYRSGLLSSS
jgi:nicotinamide riboside transporter PnuC